MGFPKQDESNSVMLFQLIGDYDGRWIHISSVTRVNDRRVLSGIFRRFRTGAPWVDIPSRYDPHTTCVVQIL